MKWSVVSLVLLGLSTTAFAKDYSCTAKANPVRGFKQAVEIQVTPAAIGGQILVKINGTERSLGTVSVDGTLKADSSSQRAAFDQTLGLIHEPDVSGLTDAQLNTVTSLRILKADIADGDEVLVYQIFAETEQIGGTFMASGMGTACLPK